MAWPWIILFVSTRLVLIGFFFILGILERRRLSQKNPQVRLEDIFRKSVLFYLATALAAFVIGLNNILILNWWKLPLWLEYHYEGFPWQGKALLFSRK